MSEYEIEIQFGDGPPRPLTEEEYEAMGFGSLARRADAAMAGESFEGHQPRECGEHRTVGPHRAWCFECTEWCYPEASLACRGCRIPMLEAQVKSS